jgi:hypothetical protein
VNQNPRGVGSESDGRQSMFGRLRESILLDFAVLLISGTGSIASLLKHQWGFAAGSLLFAAPAAWLLVKRFAPRSRAPKTRKQHEISLPLTIENHIPVSTSREIFFWLLVLAYLGGCVAGLAFCLLHGKIDTSLWYVVMAGLLVWAGVRSRPRKRSPGRQTVVGPVRHDAKYAGMTLVVSGAIALYGDALIDSRPAFNFAFGTVCLFVFAPTGLVISLTFGYFALLAAFSSTPLVLGTEIASDNAILAEQEVPTRDSGSTPSFGELSEDGGRFWNGTAWVSATSADGQMLWTGDHWSRHS